MNSSTLVAGSTCRLATYLAPVTCVFFIHSVHPVAGCKSVPPDAGESAGLASTTCRTHTLHTHRWQSSCHENAHLLLLLLLLLLLRRGRHGLEVWRCGQASKGVPDLAVH